MNVPASFASEVPAEPRAEPMRLAGEHVHRDRAIDVTYPYTGQVVAQVPKATVEDSRMALRTAAQFRTTLTRRDRYTILARAGEILVTRTEEIARLITLESGLCLKDTRHEVGRASDVLLFAAHESLRDDGEVFAGDVTYPGRKRKIYTMREPLLGAITAITPFNHPLNQVVHKVAPAVATNNRVVVKPSEKTPLAAFLLADVLYEAGLPPQMLSVVTGDPSEIADELLTNPDVDLVTFTGGVSVGKQIAARAAYKRQILELGGNDPMIVMGDADVEEAATLAASGSYKNSGQRCTAVKRILVHSEIADDFVACLQERTESLTCGDPLDPATDTGTVIDEAAATAVQDVVEDAIERGAKLRFGNERDRALYRPTILDHVSSEMPIVKNETFGPVSPVIRFRDADEAIRISNSTVYGLSSSVCTQRLDHITKFVDQLHVGTVNIWEVPGYRLELTPFGGIKDSGLGYKEGVQEATRCFTNIKTYSLPW